MSSPARPLAAAAVLVLAALLPAATTLGQSREIPAPPTQPGPVVVTGVTIHPVTGPVIDEGFIRFDGGRITDLGRGSAPASLTRNAEVVDAAGLHAWPGLISPSSQLGLSETASVNETVDSNEYGDVTPEVRACVAVNPDTDLIPVTRANGILLGCIMPTGGLVPGRCSTIRFDGWTWEQMTIDDTAGLVLSWPRMNVISAWWMRTPASQQRKQIEENLETIDELFDDAEAYLAAQAADPATNTDFRFEGMRDAIEGREPIIIEANRAAQIEAAIAWAKRRGYEIVILGGAEADQVIPLLLETKVPVIVNGLHRLPTARHADPMQPFGVPAALHEAGVEFCIASGAETAHERDLNHNAATAAAYGLPKDEAHKAVTIHAAEILGLDEHYGSLEVGKSATLILTTGDPLEITSDVLVAYIDGRRIDLGNRQKTLYEKYRTKYRQLGILGE